MIYHVWAPQMWVPKLIWVIKKDLKQIEIVPSSMYRNKYYCNPNQQKRLILQFASEYMKSIWCLVVWYFFCNILTSLTPKLFFCINPWLLERKSGIKKLNKDKALRPRQFVMMLQIMANHKSHWPQEGLNCRAITFNAVT